MLELFEGLSVEKDIRNVLADRVVVPKLVKRNNVVELKNRLQVVGIVCFFVVLRRFPVLQLLPEAPGSQKLHSF